jgi:RNA methyltransferase, TrmH family
LALSRSDIQQIRGLQQKKERMATGLFVAEGVKVVTELVASSMEVTSIYGTDAAMLGEMRGPFVRELISVRELERMSGLNTPNVILATAKIPPPKAIDLTAPLALALDGLRDPGNMGTIIRTAKWFGFGQLICSSDCVDAFAPKVVQGAMGALFHINVIYCDLKQALHDAQMHGYDTWATDLTGASLYASGPTAKTLVVIGNESNGVRPEILTMCMTKVCIPNHETEQKVESLNAATATAIILAELKRPLPR